MGNGISSLSRSGYMAELPFCQKLGSLTLHAQYHPGGPRHATLRGPGGQLHGTPANFLELRVPFLLTSIKIFAGSIFTFL